MCCHLFRIVTSLLHLSRSSFWLFDQYSWSGFERGIRTWYMEYARSFWRCFSLADCIKWPHRQNASCEFIIFLIFPFRSLKELDLGLKGELTITPDMEDLGNSLFFDQVRNLVWRVRSYFYHQNSATFFPHCKWFHIHIAFANDCKYFMVFVKISIQVPPAWTKRAYASLQGLSNWYNDLIMRIKVK